MWGQPSEEVEISIDDVNDILRGEESNANTSKRISIVENSIHRALNLDHEQNDCMDDEGRQLKKKSIENGEILGNQSENKKKPSLARKAHTFPFKDACTILPEHPSRWPQRPLMIRPTPNSSTNVIGIRVAREDDYEDFASFHDGCILPINNGREAEGESLVIDFESTHFVGTLLLRIKQAPPVPRGKAETSWNKRDESYASQEDRDSQRNYFANKKRKFQAVIKGRFRTSLPISRCVTGQTFERPAGKLPARWVVKNFIKFVSILAPQLDASLDDHMPRFLTPLVATAQTVLSEDDGYEIPCSNPSDRNSKRTAKHGDRHLDVDTGADLEEPSSLETSSILFGIDAYSNLDITIPDTTSWSVASRNFTRKKIFNALSAKRTPEPRFNTKKVYTFEFYQHLLDFGDELAVDMGRIGGMVPLAQAMDGQPLKIMATYRSSETNHELDSLWSFDIFHESLYSYAEMALDGMEAGAEENSF